ncbi:MAG: iron-containing alcohol dehydrogenase [Arenicellales bacterium]|jgi:alcohol dehydrogenase class IV|nr:iron-containing alcohol dehydrogenase [Arenicellales bacterium]MDP6723801.1 iron-containing alcohol dehydrogenase [Arenicellales bacterium]|tara:strand:+ start:37353 stop:38498 length:1146 start_codon:yes stop_codon:yes gene_type:complete
MTLSANWSFPTSIRFGEGRVCELADVCQQSGISNPLLVTDRVLAEFPMITRVISILKEGGFNPVLFSKVDPNPTERNVEEGLELYRSGHHDGVIAMGGGSALDLGKILAFMVRQQRPLWDFEDIGDWWKRADEKVIDPIIAIPTTSGTGAEVGRASVITDSVNHLKKIIFHPKILPSQVICDPQLTVTMPQVVTVGTGMDALVHCIEAFSSPHYHPMSQGIALEGMRLVFNNLPKVFNDGGDIVARSHLMSAAAMGAVAFQKGLGASHAVSHPVGALYNTPHGMTNAVVIPYVLEMNREAIEKQISGAANYLDMPGGFDGFHGHLTAMSRELNVPQKLADLGVDRKHIDVLTRMALEDPSAAGNPIKMEYKNTRALIEASL